MRLFLFLSFSRPCVLCRVKEQEALQDDLKKKSIDLCIYSGVIYPGKGVLHCIIWFLISAASCQVAVKNGVRKITEAGRQRRYVLSVRGGHDGQSTGTCKVFWRRRFVLCVQQQTVDFFQ